MAVLGRDSVTLSPRYDVEGQAMTSAAARELATMSLGVNYHRWMYAVTRPYVGERVLDLGGGIGSFSYFFQDRQRLVIVDNDPYCVRHLSNRFGNHENVRVVDGDMIDPALPDELGHEMLDTAVCMNVLEHIEDDRTVLRHIYRALQPGGHLILLVPANPRLYGTLDERVGHVRRYGRAELTEKVRDANFAVCRAFYFNSVGTLGWYMISRIRRQQAIDRRQVRLYDRFVVPILARAERLVRPPFGQSLIVVGRK